MRKVYKPKGAAEQKKYGFNWSPQNIGTERIIIFSATVQTGTATIAANTVEDVPNARDGQGTTFVLAGGTPGETTEVLLHAETNAVPPSILEQLVYIPIR